LADLFGIAAGESSNGAGVAVAVVAVLGLGAMGFGAYICYKKR